MCGVDAHFCRSAVRSAARFYGKGMDCSKDVLRFARGCPRLSRTDVSSKGKGNSERSRSYRAKLNYCLRWVEVIFTCRLKSQVGIWYLERCEAMAFSWLIVQWTNPCVCVWFIDITRLAGKGCVTFMRLVFVRDTFSTCVCDWLMWEGFNNCFFTDLWHFITTSCKLQTMSCENWNYVSLRYISCNLSDSC